MKFSKSNIIFSFLPGHFIHSIKFINLLFVNVFWFTLIHNLTTKFPYLLWGSSNINTIIWLWSRLLDNQKGILISWIIRHFCCWISIITSQFVFISSHSYWFYWLIKFNDSCLKRVTNHWTCFILKTWSSSFCLRYIKFSIRTYNSACMKTNKTWIIYFILILKWFSITLLIMSLFDCSIIPKILKYHFIFSKSSCFIRNNTSHRSKSLNYMQILN